MSLNSAVTAKYNLGPVKPWVEQAAYQIGPQFGIKTVYGWRKSDPFPDHPSGHALDFMIPNLSVGQKLADYVIANHVALGVKYLIFNHRAWDPQIGWHPYTSTNNPHTDHVHVTFLDQPGTGVIVPIGSGGQGGGSTVDNCAWTLTSPIRSDICVISNPQARALLGGVTMAIGAGIVLFGVSLLVVYALRKNVPGLSSLARVGRG